MHRFGAWKQASAPQFFSGASLASPLIIPSLSLARKTLEERVCSGREAMSELAEREGVRFAENPVIAGEQHLPIGDETQEQSPTTPVYRRGFGFDDDESDHHHEKRSVLMKVKEKAKKWRHMLAKKKPGQHEDSSPTAWGSSLDEEDEEEEDDPEYHGAPMYESETVVPYAYKDVASPHQAAIQGLGSLEIHLPNNANEGGGAEHNEPALHRLDSFRETSTHHIMVDRPPTSLKHLLEDTTEPGDHIKEISSSKTYCRSSSDTHVLMANKRNEGPFKKSYSIKAKHAVLPDTHHLMNVISSSNANHSTLFDRKLLETNTYNNPASSNKDLFGDSINHEDQIKESGGGKGDPFTFLATPLLIARAKQELSGANTKQEDHINEGESRKMNHPVVSDTMENSGSKVNYPAIINKNDLGPNTEHEFSIKESGDNNAYPSASSNTQLLMAKAKHEDSIREIDSSNAKHPAFPDTHLFTEKTLHDKPINESDSSKANHLAPFDAHDTMANTKREELIKEMLAARSSKTLTETVSEMFAPAYTMVSDTSHTIASKILCPTDGDEIGAMQTQDPVKGLTKAVSEMLTPAYTVVSDASHMIASKIHSPRARDEMGEKAVHDTFKEGRRHKTLTNTLSEMPASTTQSATARDEIGAKMAHDPMKQSTRHKTITETVTGMLAPAYTMVSDASNMIASKIHGSAGGSDTGTNEVSDKGVSVKEYLMHKLEPGEEDKALSQVITEVMSPRMVGQGRAEEVGVVEKVRGAVSSLLKREKHTELQVAEERKGPILPVSTHPRAVEIEEIGAGESKLTPNERRSRCSTKLDGIMASV